MDEDTISRVLCDVAENIRTYAKDGDCRPFSADEIREFVRQLNQVADDMEAPVEEEKPV